MTNATPIAILWTALERVEPRYQRALTVEARLESQLGAASDNPRLRRARNVVDATGREMGTIIRMIVDLRAASLSDLSLKAMLGLKREDDVAVFQSLARDVLYTAAGPFTPRPRAGRILLPGSLAT